MGSLSIFMWNLGASEEDMMWISNDHLDVIGQVNNELTGLVNHVNLSTVGTRWGGDDVK